ncbi:hypothetical protein HNP73_000279 [Amaricoccus macauensis]|uniref:Uncharacterized protein n=1 Tax=Amaricoccus macauensis TaxID=57001 RepID=A0A840SJN2_9RHOB|nr:hypothetical protein [Amaricoccus macauensis]MBB5220358.1 hypothetical protein [Amaricoccus macauensis]
METIATALTVIIGLVILTFTVCGAYGLGGWLAVAAMGGVGSFAGMLFMCGGARRDREEEGGFSGGRFHPIFTRQERQG